jgi:uncharacterized peroxidase-related enzyme
MPHVSVPPDLPGITGLLATKPAVGRKFTEFVHELMRGPSPLSPGERELIAAFVSSENECRFCANSHAAAARHALPDPDGTLVAAVLADVHSAGVSERIRALLLIADKVRIGGHQVTAADIARAREAGADDEQLHDTVLIAAAFSLANRYVDGLDALTPDDPGVYDDAGKRLATTGYLQA